MKKPKTLEIGCRKYTIFYVKPGAKGSPLLEHELGAVSSDDGLIWLAKGMGGMQQLTTLVHEILHAIADTMEGDKNPFAKESYNRTFTTLLAQALITSGLIKTD